MRYLLLLVSFLFSFIFYTFYAFTQNKGILWGQIENGGILQTLLPFPLFYVSIFFIFLGIVFYILLSDPKKKDKRGPINVKELLKVLQKNVKNIMYIFPFLSVFIGVLFLLLWIELNNLTLGVIYFIFSFIFYFGGKYLPVISSKNILFGTSKYIGVISSYISIIFSILFFWGENIGIFLYGLLGYGILFNFYIHFRFKNYISLVFGIVSLLFFTYKLFDAGLII